MDSTMSSAWDTLMRIYMLFRSIVGFDVLKGFQNFDKLPVELQKYILGINGSSEACRTQCMLSLASKHHYTTWHKDKESCFIDTICQIHGEIYTGHEVVFEIRGDIYVSLRQNGIALDIIGDENIKEARQQVNLLQLSDYLWLDPYDSFDFHQRLWIPVLDVNVYKLIWRLSSPSLRVFSEFTVEPVHGHSKRGNSNILQAQKDAFDMLVALCRT